MKGSIAIVIFCASILLLFFSTSVQCRDSSWVDSARRRVGSSSSMRLSLSSKASRKNGSKQQRSRRTSSPSFSGFSGFGGDFGTSATTSSSGFSAKASATARGRTGSSARSSARCDSSGCSSKSFSSTADPLETSSSSSPSDQSESSYSSGSGSGSGAFGGSTFISPGVTFWNSDVGSTNNSDNQEGKPGRMPGYDTEVDGDSQEKDVGYQINTPESSSREGAGDKEEQDVGYAATLLSEELQVLDAVGVVNQFDKCLGDLAGPGTVDSYAPWFCIPFLFGT